MAGRPRTPTAVLDARGSFKKHPERKREDEPEVTEPLGAAPGRLSEQERIAWDEITSTAPLGVLTQADRLHVEQTATLLAESWTEGTEFHTSKRNLLNRMLGQVGMNPADRSKISVPKVKRANPFESLS